MPDAYDELLSAYDPPPKPKAGGSRVFTIQNEGDPSKWGLHRLPEIEAAYQARFGRKPKYGRIGQGSGVGGWQHQNNADFSDDPDTPEGQFIMDFMRQNNMPFRASTVGGVQRNAQGRIISTGKHIHAGPASGSVRRTSIPAPARSTQDPYDALLANYDAPTVKRETPLVGADGQPLAPPPIDINPAEPTELPPILTPEQYEAQRRGATPLAPVAPTVAPQQAPRRILRPRPAQRVTRQVQAPSAFDFLGRARQAGVVSRSRGIPTEARTINIDSLPSRQPADTTYEPQGSIGAAISNAVRGERDTGTAGARMRASVQGRVPTERATVREQVRREIEANRGNTGGALAPVTSMLLNAQGVNNEDVERATNERMAQMEAERTELQRFFASLSPEQRKEYQDTKAKIVEGFRSGSPSEQAVYGGLRQKSADVRELMGGAYRLANSTLKGILPDSLLNTDDEKRQRMIALAYRDAVNEIDAERPIGTGGEILRAGIKLPLDLAQVAVATAVTRNPAIAFGGMSALQRAGQGGSTVDVIKEGARGAATGKLFELASSLPLVPKVAGVGAGSYAIDRAAGSNDAEAKHDALVNSVFAALTGRVNLLSLAGKAIRLRNGRTTVDATVNVTPEGKPTLVEGKAENAAPVVDMEYREGAWQPKATRVGQRLLRGRAETQEPPVESSAPVPPLQPRQLTRGTQGVSAESAPVAPVEPVAETKTVIRHADPRIDGGEIVGRTSDGKLKVQNNEGGLSVVQNPRTTGNRNAAIQKVRENQNVETGQESNTANSIGRSAISDTVLNPRADAEVYGDLENRAATTNAPGTGLAVEQGREAARAGAARDTGLGRSAGREVSPSVAPIVRRVTTPAPPTPPQKRAAQMFVPEEKPQNLTRNFRAGTNDASMTFASETQRNLYDLAAKSKYQMRGGQNKAGQRAVGDISSLRESVKQRLGVDDAEAMRLAYQVHDDVRAQMKGVKHLEERRLVDNSTSKTSAPTRRAEIPLRPSYSPPTEQEMVAVRNLAAKELAPSTGRRVVPSKPVEQGERQAWEMTRDEVRDALDGLATAQKKRILFDNYNKQQTREYAIPDTFTLGDVTYHMRLDVMGAGIKGVDVYEVTEKADPRDWAATSIKRSVASIKTNKLNKSVANKIIDAVRRDQVERAIAKGKSVPVEVLKEYPDIQSQGQEKQSLALVPAVESRRTVVPETSRQAERQPQKEEKPKREFSSTQINLPDSIAKDVRAASMKIPDADLAADGREGKPHVTVKFGTQMMQRMSVNF
jgi:hypothetical protein